MSKKKRVGQAYKGRRIEEAPVKKMKSTKWVKEQLKTFWYWINERHAIYLRKETNSPVHIEKDGDEDIPFWTNDKILDEYKFTNTYRQLDRVTQEWTERYMRLRHLKTKRQEILFHCMVFRLFNWPPTYDALNYAGLIDRWNMKKAIKLLKERMESSDDEKRQIFTGAYIIPNGGSSDPKIEVICGALDWVHQHREEICKDICEPRNARRQPMLPSMEQAVNVLQNIWTIGPFIAYEIACDLRHTSLLADASDVNSWANAGPGAKRGIHRLMCGDAKMPGPKPDYNAKMRELLGIARKSLDRHVFKCEWPFEMREIEHSLCEFDKYMRVKNDEGRPRSKYRKRKLKKSTLRAQAKLTKAQRREFSKIKRARKLAAEAGQQDMFEGKAGQQDMFEGK